MSACPFTYRALPLVAILLFASGCQSRYVWPNFAHPGPANYQRAVADKFDPYPSPHDGPEIVGGRPLGYTRPYSDTEWGRRYGSPIPRLAPAGLPAFAPTVSGGAPPPVVITPTLPPAPAIPSQIQPRSPY